MNRRLLRLRKLIINSVLHADDTPHAIALGAGLAMFVAVLPLIGVQLVCAIGLATLFRANKAIGIPIVWITNPLTMVPIYYGCYRVGHLVTGSNRDEGTRIMENLMELGRNIRVLDPQFWKDFALSLAGLGWEMWIGCCICGTLAALATYLFTRWGVIRYRERRRIRVLRRNLFRPLRKAASAPKGV